MNEDGPMSSGGAGAGDGPGRGSGRLNGQPVVRPGAKIIPLTVRTTGARDPAAMKAAVVQVVRHLVLEKVPPDRRSPLFDQACALLDEAGWGLDELIAAADEGPARQRLFGAIGL
ncbi:MAG TPA: hypothetical protein VF069_12950 [Streptosporangiaceae bacterium]